MHDKANGTPTCMWQWLGILMLAVPVICRADSFRKPCVIEAMTAERSIVASTLWKKTGGTNEVGSLYVGVSEIKGGNRRLLWETPLTNRIAPSVIYVSSDGSRVVTLDNWRPRGYGNDLVVFYGPQGVIRQYDLPSAVGMSEKELDAKLHHVGYSRPWCEEHVPVFVQQDARTVFGLWLPWRGKWLAWNLEDGKGLTVDDKLATVCAQAAEPWARSILAAGGKPSDADLVTYADAAVDAEARQFAVMSARSLLRTLTVATNGVEQTVGAQHSSAGK